MLASASQHRPVRDERPESAGRAAPVRQTGGVLFSFAPWIIFGVVSSPSTWKYAVLAALLASVVLCLPDLKRGAPKMLNLTGLVFFVVLGVLAFFLDRGDLYDLEKYSQVIANTVIAVVALGSLAFVPFTEQYAREQTPPEVWRSPLFRKVNVRLTALWGGAFALSAVSYAIGLQTSAGSDWFNWIIPIGLLVVAIKVTAWYPDHVRATALRTDSSGAAPSSPPP
ncbi:hypothetical protein [Streptomyces sp. NPDC048650]|uniref:hypothetical protein n=1 Tax=unclassified Streptomyces TaxID=2593676 RepID=UPI003718008F